MENLNRTVSEKLNLNHVNDVVNEKVKDINGKLTTKLDSLNGKINGMNLSFNGKVNEEKVKSVADRSVNFLKTGLEKVQEIISKFCAFVKSSPVFGLLAAIFAVPLFFCLLILVILSPILVPWVAVVLTIAVVTFLIAASFFLLKVFIGVTVVSIIAMTVKKILSIKDRAATEGGAGVTFDKVVSSLTESSKEYVEYVKKYSAASLDYARTGYAKSVSTVKDLVEKCKGGEVKQEKPEKPEEPQKSDVPEPEAEEVIEEKPEDEKKNE